MYVTLEDNMQDSLGEEDEETQRVVDNRDMDIRQMRRNARRDKRNFIEELTEEAEAAADQKNMKSMYEINRTLSGKTSNPY